jgi:hypothetical protein
MDETNALSEAESKYFETGGKAELPPESTLPLEEKPVEKAKEPEAEEAKADKPDKPIELVTEDEIEDEPDARKYVKVGVVRKEREEKKQLKLRAEQAEQGRAELERRIQAMQNPPRQLQPEEVPQVALERVQRLENQLNEQSAKQNFVQTYAQKAQEFITGTDDEPGVPDFGDAYKHALNTRRAVYQISGFGEADITKLLESEEAAIVERAMIEGKNPAKVIYDIAKQFGYQPKAKEAAKDDPVNEQVKKQAATADKTLEAAKKLEKIAKGMDKNKSLGGGGGGNEAPSLEELLDMDEGEFSKHTSGKKFREMMGG